MDDILCVRASVFQRVISMRSQVRLRDSVAERTVKRHSSNMCVKEDVDCKELDSKSVIKFLFNFFFTKFAFFPFASNGDHVNMQQAYPSHHLCTGAGGATASTRV